VARPKQARSQETLYRLLDAAEALIDEKGLADVSVPDIVRRAASSVGGFYARFRDKDELLRALEERFFQEMAERLAALTAPERWAGASIRQIVSACVAELVTTSRERRALISAFVSRAARDPRFLEDGLRFRRSASQRVVALLSSRRDAISHPDPELAIDLGVQLAFGLMHEIVIFGDMRAGSRVLSDADLERELTHNLLAYLGLSESAPDERSTP
jgi:AcrR family transcriptional regulator